MSSYLTGKETVDVVSSSFNSNKLLQFGQKKIKFFACRVSEEGDDDDNDDNDVDNEDGLPSSPTSSTC